MKKVQYLYVAMLSSVMLPLTGCSLRELPDTFEVAMSAGERLSAPRNSGAADAVNSTWAGFRKADPAPAEKAAPGPYGGLLTGGIVERPPVNGKIFVADFGAAGEITAIRENRYFLPQIYGEQIDIGGDWAKAKIPLLRFKSASYGLQLGERYGFAVLVHVSLGRAYVGRAIIYSWGSIGEDRLDGTFGYLLDFTGGLADLVLDSGGDQYPFYAEKLP